MKIIWYMYSLKAVILINVRLKGQSTNILKLQTYKITLLTIMTKKVHTSPYNGPVVLPDEKICHLSC